MSMSIYGYDYTDGRRPKPAAKRFSDARAVHDVYEQYRRYELKDQERRTKIQSMYDMFLPFDPEELRAAGQAWRANFNSGALKNAIDARTGAVNAIANDTYDLITLDSPSQFVSGPNAEAAYAVISEEISRAIREDGRVIPALAAMSREADLFGVGPISWRDPESYVPQPLRRGQVVFDPEAPVHPDDHDIVFVDTVMDAATLFRIVDNPEVSSAAGWNVPALRRWIVAVFHDGVDTRSDATADGGVGAMESAVAAIRRSDFYEQHQFRRFHVLDVYVREMKAPRKITHLIVPATSSVQPGGDPEREFLYEKEDAYDSMVDAVNWLVSDPSAPYIRSVRGIASDIAPKAAVKDRCMCAQADAVIRALSMVVKEKNPGATPQLSLQELGPYTIVGQDYDPVPNANQMSNFQGVAAFMQQLEASSTGSLAGTEFGVVAPPLQEGGSAASKRDAEIAERRTTRRDENFRASRLKAVCDVMRIVYDRFMAIATGPEIVRREYPRVAEFVSRCAERGVTSDMLREARKSAYVTVSRELVIGLDGLSQFLTSMLTQFGGTADEVGRKKMAHAIARVQLGRKLANEFFPVESRDSGPSNDASVATLENNAIRAGQPVLMGPDQRQIVHIRVHMQLVQEVQQAVESGVAEAQREWQEEGRMQQSDDGRLAPKVENPEELMRILQATSQHIQEHLSVFSLQPGAKAQAKEIQQVLSGLGDLTQALNLAIATQRRVREAEEEKRQRELDELRRAADEAEIAKANHKADLEAQNARHKIDLDHQVALERLRMEGETMRGKNRLEFESARNRAIIESEQARQEMARKGAAAQQDLQIRRESAGQAAQIEAAQAAQQRLESRNNVRAVTGRQAPRPSDIAGAANQGVIPL